MTCILCLSNAANTKEHRIKSSIFRKIFGRGHGLRFLTNNLDKYKIAQGPRSQVLQFEAKNLCAKCNNQESQQGDRAFDELDEALQKTADTLTWKEDESVQACAVSIEPALVRSASTYFAKFLLCKLHDSDFPIPDELRALFWEKDTGVYGDFLFIDFLKSEFSKKIEVQGPLVPIPRAFLKSNRKEIHSTNYKAEYYAVSITANNVRYTYVFFDTTRVSEAELKGVPEIMTGDSVAACFKSD